MTSEPRYHRSPATVLSQGTVVKAFEPLSQTIVYLPERSAHLLSMCEGWKTLEEHAIFLIRTGMGEFEEILACLNKLQRSGLFLSSTALPEAQPEISSPIVDVVIPTANRPEQLARLLRAFLSQATACPDSTRLHIIDNSTPSMIGSNQLMISALNVKRDMEIRHWHPARISDYKRRLNKTCGIPHDMLDFALSGSVNGTEALGAHRNIALLLTVGERVLSLDDDTVPSARLPRYKDLVDDTPVLSGEFDPTEFWFFSNRTELMKGTDSCSLNILAEHGKILGNSPASVLTKLDRLCGSQNPSSEGITDLFENRGRVVVSHNGVAGDSGMHSGYWIPLVRQVETRNRLLSSVGNFDTGCTSREVLRQSNQLRVTPTSHLMSTFVGLDNRNFLPPFFPVGRNEDGMFGTIIGCCDPKAYTAYLPFSLIHAPIGKRRYDSNVLGYRISDLLIGWLRGQRSNVLGLSPHEECRRIGRQMKSVASLSPSEFRAMVRSLVWRRNLELIEAHESILTEYGEMPDFWNLSIRQRLRELRANLIHAGFSGPTDITAASVDASMAVVQKLFGRYGAMLENWQYVRESAALMLKTA